MKRRFIDITLGADPEVFLVDEKGNNISAIGKIGGSKENPRSITDLGHAVQEDNVLAEFNIPASKTAEDFSNNIKLCIDWLDDNLSPLKTKITASGTFADSELDNPVAQEAGCNPDFNAWTGDENIAPQLGKTNLRSAGGHVAVGYSDPDPEVSIEILKLMDLFLGIPSVLLDKDTERRKLYGKAGCYRLKPFGLEYRTLSNYWIATDELRQWVFNNTIAALKYLEKNKSIQDNDFEVIQTAINTNNLKLANRLRKKYNVKMPDSFNELDLHFDLLEENEVVTAS